MELNSSIYVKANDDRNRKWKEGMGTLGKPN